MTNACEAEVRTTSARSGTHTRLCWVRKKFEDAGVRLGTPIYADLVFWVTCLSAEVGSTEGETMTMTEVIASGREQYSNEKERIRRRLKASGSAIELRPDENAVTSDVGFREGMSC